MTNPSDPPTDPQPVHHPHELEPDVQELRRQARNSEVRRVAAEGELERLREQLARLEREAEAHREAVARLRGELSESGAELSQARQVAAQRQRDAEQVTSIAVAALQNLRAEIDRIETSTAWRVGHRAATTWSRVRMRRLKTGGAVDRARDRLDEVIATLSERRGERLALPAPRSAVPQLPRGREEDESAIEEDGLATALSAVLRERLDRPPSREEWPAVTLALVDRGEHALGPLLHALARTDYPALNIALVSAETPRAENAAADAGLASRTRVVTVESSIAAACNALAEGTSDPLLAFLEDTVPFEPGWLKELVDALLATGTGAVTATVLAPVEAGGDDGVTITVQERGRILVSDGGAARLAPQGAGESVFGPHFGTETACAAIASGCFVIDRETFLNVGGFDTGYRSGGEVHELSLSLAAAGGRAVCSGRAFVIASADAGAGSEGGSYDVRRLSERWGPALRRELRLALARREPRWAGGAPMRIAIPRRGAEPDELLIAGRLGAALTRLGWRVDQMEHPISWHDGPLDANVDAVLVLDPELDPAPLPPGTTAIALIRDREPAWLAQPHFDRYDILLASTAGTARRVFAATGREPVLFPPATDPRAFTGAFPNRELASDYALVGPFTPDQEPFEAVLAPRNGEQPAFVGPGWKKRGPLRRFARDDVPEDRLPALLASAKVVIDRVENGGELGATAFDALAAGTPVITPHAEQARELFDEDFPTFSDPTSLRAGLDTLLGGAEQRILLARRYRRRVLSEHTYTQRAQRLRELISARDDHLSFCLKIGPADWAQATHWGDLYLARDLARALGRQGHRTLVQVRSEWNDPVALGYDVAVHIKGRYTYSPHPGQFNVLWLISHPTELALDDANGYDLVCVASEAFAETLRGQLTTPVAVLEQASDPWRFFPDPRPELTHDLVFVGNSRGAQRPALKWLRGLNHDIAVWGSGLEESVDPRQLKGDWFPNEELRALYSSTKLVLCEHWEDMRQRGFASNRIYDALACGAVVLCDDVADLGDRFGDAVVTYSGEDELRRAVNRLLASREERERRAEGARERIVRAHTFDHRARELAALVAEHAPLSGFRSRIAA